MLQRELLKAKDVKRISFYGDQKEAVYVEMRREKMSQLGVSQQDIYNTLGSKNIVASAGTMDLGQKVIPINPTGEFKSEQDFGDLIITPSNPNSQSLIYLRDVAEIKREYRDPPTNLLRFDGQPAIGLGISTIQGGNVVAMGVSLDERLKELETLRPVGMELHTISHQADSVTTALNGFIVNLAEAVVIVVLVLLVFMGLRSALILGVVLLITIMGTFIFMQMMHVTLERISLGALIIALGMLVDCAIVVADGIRMRMQRGQSGLAAATEVVAQNALPMLGGTVVAITAFAAIGTSSDSTGEYCRSLFTVILVSLSLSWLTAVTCTPLFCSLFFKQNKEADTSGTDDPYAGGFFLVYRNFLVRCIRHRWLVVGVVIAMFAISVIGFGSIKNSFFPDSTRPQFYVDLWFPEGTDIHETQRQVEKAEAYLKKQEGVTHLSSLIGGGQTRFLLTYSPENPYPSFAQILIDVDDYSRIETLNKQVQNDMEAMFPDGMVTVRLFVLGPSSGGKIQLRLYGPDSDELRRLAAKAEDILYDEPNLKAIRNEWREKIKVLRPQLAEAQARKAGVDRKGLAQAFAASFEGSQTGVYRESDELLPIIARSPERERADLNSLASIPVWSPAAQAMIPMGQLVSEFAMDFENPHLWRWDRRKMIRIHADPREGLPSEVFAKLKVPIEKALDVDVATVLGQPSSNTPIEHEFTTLKVKNNDLWPIKNKPGYYMAWGGEAEDSARANANLAGSIPMFFGLMVLIVLVLFNSIKKTLILWLTVPLALIGVTTGLLSFSQPFGFMALLGLMSLSGMLIKAAIVVLDEIDVLIGQGKEPLEAVLQSGVSRLIPVCMSSGTTMLGMIPLFGDAFFVSMAVTIVIGLGFSTLLILIFVPVLYAIFYKVPNQGEKAA